MSRYEAMAGMIQPAVAEEKFSLIIKKFFLTIGDQDERDIFNNRRGCRRQFFDSSVPCRRHDIAAKGRPRRNPGTPA